MKPCPFCFSDGRPQKIRGAAAEMLHAIGRSNDQCLAVGPIGRNESEAEQKWNLRNLNITSHVRQK
jgi:hypothetical protein